jgi:hypothetical protein
MTSCARALSYISTVTPLRAVTFAESSESRELFWRSRSYASDMLQALAAYKSAEDGCLVVRADVS